MQWYGLLRQTISLHFFIGCLAQILLGSFSIPRNLSVLRKDLHCVKSVRIRSFSGPYFPTIGTNTERYGLPLRIQSECGELRTRKTPNMVTFHAVFGNKNHTHQIFTNRKGMDVTLQFFDYLVCISKVKNDRAKREKLCLRRTVI